MFQNFDAPAAPVVGDARLAKLRNHMREQNIDALIVPHADEQNNEYLPADKERLAWLSGFTGSAGNAIITADQAVLFVDGRYTLQAADQTDANHWRIDSIEQTPLGKWLGLQLQPGQTIGIDPWLHTSNQVKGLKKTADKAGAELVELNHNPIDKIWDDQPPHPLEHAFIHDFSFAGRLTRDKLEEVQAALAANNADLCVLTDPTSVCWLFNIRGNDVAHTPLILSHALLRADDEPILFIDKRKLNVETRAYLTQVATLHAPSELDDILREQSNNARVMLDPDLAAHAITTIVEHAGGTVVRAKDPVRLPRALKNDVEIAGSKTAHLRDGAAMVSFLAWLDSQQTGTIDEITAAEKLEQTRTEMGGDFPLREISFDTISGTGPNGAIVHYRVNEDTNRLLQDGDLYLCDSGAQYDDGTTDITRTIAIGSVGEEERHAFTLVLRGHIAIAQARFPKGTRGVDLDPLARISLWQNGMDYAHGTGHGVGSYLSVHEGPQNISKRGMQELLPGMIVSNEPGYYRKDQFGIRIENLVLVRESMEISGGDQPMMGFETLSLAPIDQRLIDATMMSRAELHWLNAYHGWVHRELEPLVSDEVAEWLREATKPLSSDLPSASA
ncbi:MAG: aminopeptidase P family protein [Rhizobiaceae bacterium]